MKKKTTDPELPSNVSKRSELKQVEERVAIGAHVVHETIKREGEDEFKRTSSALAWSGLAAGLSMGFSLVAEALLSGVSPRERVDGADLKAWLLRGIPDRCTWATATLYGEHPITAIVTLQSAA